MGLGSSRALWGQEQESLLNWWLAWPIHPIASFLSACQRLPHPQA